MQVTNNKKERVEHVKVGDTLITPGCSMKYLGVVVDDKLTFKDHLKQKVGKMTKLGNATHTTCGKMAQAEGTKPTGSEDAPLLHHRPYRSAATPLYHQTDG
jgi:hypothetical protein